MKILLSKHAIRRSKERGVETKILRTFIKNPDKVEISSINSNRLIIKKNLL